LLCICTIQRQPTRPKYSFTFNIMYIFICACYVCHGPLKNSLCTDMVSNKLLKLLSFYSIKCILCHHGYLLFYQMYIVSPWLPVILSNVYCVTMVSWQSTTCILCHHGYLIFSQMYTVSPCVHSQVVIESRDLQPPILNSMIWSDVIFGLFSILPNGRSRHVYP
jgi:hypothetical protein